MIQSDNFKLFLMYGIPSTHINWFFFLQLKHSFFRDIGNNYVYPSLNWPGVALAKESNSSLVDFGKNEVIFHLDVLEKHYLCHHEFLCGNSSTIADCWVAVVLSLLELVCFDLTPWPRLRSWVCSMKSNGDYVDVSYNHEEMVRKSFYNLNSSASDLKTECWESHLIAWTYFSTNSIQYGSFSRNLFIDHFIKLCKCKLQAVSCSLKKNRNSIKGCVLTWPLFVIPHYSFPSSSHPLDCKEYW